jgi:hypothetical protein
MRADDAARLRRDICRFRIFKSEDPAKRARAIVKATGVFQRPGKGLEASMGLGNAMPGIEMSEIPENTDTGNAWMVASVNGVREVLSACSIFRGMLPNTVIIWSVSVSYTRP